jgi:hypothetical protein
LPKGETLTDKTDEIVGPEEWPHVLKLFDNGKYSVITDGDSKLGMGWNASSNPLTLPNMAGYARALDTIWHIVPSFLEIPILHALLDELARNSGIAINPEEKLILPEIKRRHSKNP